MKRLSFGFIAILMVTHLNLPTLQAAGGLTQQQPIEINVSMGNEGNAFQFFPDFLQFETVKLYRLILINPTPPKKYFFSEGPFQPVFTYKFQMNDGDGKPIDEIKGLIRKIGVYPKRVGEGWFVPAKTVEFDDLKCTVLDHAEGGMI